MREIKLKIEGMHCAGCSNRLEKILNNVDYSSIDEKELIKIGRYKIQ